MLIVHTINELRAIVDAERSNGRVVGLVPTMGALHDGHASLMETATKSVDFVVASVFVNPLQFAPDEDLDSYPRMVDHDAALAEQSGVDVLFVPSNQEMYPQENWTTVSVQVISEPWEGASRPTHFDGVATVVAKLFGIVGRCHAFFGEKDYQQLALINQMTRDLNMDIEVVGVPTVREPDGLAMSSRNLRLTPEHRKEAPIVHRALQAGIERIEAGETDPAAVERVVRSVIDSAENASPPDYVAVVDAETLRTPEVLSGAVRLLTAVRFGNVRLIDNVGVTIP